jgi:hypothetical protein
MERGGCARYPAHRARVLGHSVYFAVKWWPARDSLIRRMTSLMARFNSLLGRNKFPVPMRGELRRKPLSLMLDCEPVSALGGPDEQNSLYFPSPAGVVIERRQRDAVFRHGRRPKCRRSRSLVESVDDRGAAEAAERAGRRLVESDQIFALDPPEVGGTDPGGAAERGALLFAAHRAVVIPRGPQRPVISNRTPRQRQLP